MSKATEYCLRVFDGTHETPKPTSHGFKLLTSKNILNGTLNKNDAYYISEEDYNSINQRSQVSQWDVLFSMIGTVGNVCIITDKDIDFAIKNMGCFSCKDEKRAKWLYYYLQSPTIKRLIQYYLNGAVQKFVPLDWLRNIDIPDFDKSKEKIVNILWNLDAKISLNRSIISDLELLSRQIYDYWFVQFDFPDEHGRPYKSSGGKMVWNEKIKRHIPAGWEVLPLFEAVNVQYGFPFSTELFTDEVTSIPIVRIRDILDGTISAYSLESTDEKYRLQKGDVLVGMDGNFHMNYWHDNNAYLNQRCVRLRPRLDLNISAMQIFYGIQPYIKAKEKVTKGSTVGHLSDKDMKELCLLKPLITKYFNPAEIFNSLLNRVIENKQENLSLTTLRDFLLPMLMNGQVTVK